MGLGDKIEKIKYDLSRQRVTLMLDPSPITEKQIFAQMRVDHDVHMQEMNEELARLKAQNARKQAIHAQIAAVRDAMLEAGGGTLSLAHQNEVVKRKEIAGDLGSVDWKELNTTYRDLNGIIQEKFEERFGR